ncbi:MAG: hypothetical protein Phog2KO_46510 [Phototrophicaceae bacterium]
MSRRNLTIALISFMALWMTITTSAQDNLLQNPGFNTAGNYVDQRPSGSAYAFAIAPGWNGWQTLSPSTESWMNIEPIAYPHTGGSKREGDASQNIGRGDATFTAAVYQTISGVAEGSTYRFTVWALHDSDAGSGSQTRVGIGSNVGGNPFGSPITWSPWMTSIDSWQQVTVEATVPAGSVTVFIYSTQSSPNAGNQNYYDDASLVLVGGDGAVDVGDGQTDAEGTVVPPAPPTSTPQTFAPFVSIQPTQETGEIVHTVQSGDTLAAISAAYGVPTNDILELNGLTRDEARFLGIGQQLIISEADPNAVAATEDEDTAEDTGSEENEETVTEESSENAGFASPTPQEVAQEATSIPSPTPVPTEEDVEDVEEEPTKEPTPDVTATPTEIPATPTDAPPAPVEQGEDTDPLAIDTGVCTLMFDDSNSNNIQDANEDLLSGGQITISADGAEPQEYITDGSEPFCFDELDPGLYTMTGVAPDGYGLNSSVRSVSIQAGQAFTVSFGAIEGLEVAAVPTIDTASEIEQPIVEETPDASNNFRNIAGILVLGLAGVVLVGGVGVGFIVGRN